MSERDIKWAMTVTVLMLGGYCLIYFSRFLYVEFYDRYESLQKSLEILEFAETDSDEYTTEESVKTISVTPVPTQTIIKQETTVIYEAEQIDYTVPIMTGIILAVVVIGLCFIVCMYKLYADKKKKEMEYNKQILQMELHTFEQEAVNKLKEKYENQK